MAKSQAWEEAISHSGWMVMFGWYPLLAKNGETSMVALGVLLQVNSARDRSSDQLSC